MKIEAMLSDLAASLRRLDEALEREAADDLYRAGCIQYFEFTFELAWKSIRAVSAYHGIDPVRSPRAAFKTAFSQTWITDQEPWIAMLEARNRMSHVYNASEALAVFEQLPAFTAPLEDLHQRLVEVLAMP